jgi:hypothetical protein
VQVKHALVAIVDDRVPRTVLPGESAIGQRFREPSQRGRAWRTVIGVVTPVHAESFERDPLQQVYWNYAQWTQDRTVLSIRSTRESSSLLPVVLRHSIR